MAKLRAGLLQGPGLNSTSPDFDRRKYLINKQCKTTNISKKLHKWNRRCNERTYGDFRD